MGSLFVRDRQFYRHFFVIALPVVLQSCITIGVNMLDTIMLGSFGEGYLSATSLSNQFFNLYQIICMGLGGGAAVLTAQAWGRKDGMAIKKAVTIMLRIAITAAVLFTIVTCLFPRQIMSIYTKEALVLDDCERYFQYLCYCFFFQGIALTLTQVLRSVKETRVPLLAAILSFFTNLFFNYVMIFGKLGFPRMEIEGAALATLIARIAECVFIGGYVFFFDQRMKYRLKDLTMRCRDQLGEYLHYGLPVLMSDFLLGLGNNAIAVVMGHISQSFVAAFSITSITQQMCNIFTTGVTNASSVIVGNTLGEKDGQKAYEQGKTFIVMSVILGIAAALVILLIREPVISMYNIEPETVAITRSLMDGVSFMIIFRMMGSVLTKGVLRGGGDTRFLMIADIIFLWCASVPLGYLAGIVLRLSAFWTFFFLNIDHFIKSFWCLLRFRSKKWIHIIER